MPIPAVTDPGDAVLRVTSTAICGSDLHLYAHAMPGLKAGDVLGHEFMGVVEEVRWVVWSGAFGDPAAVCERAACVCVSAAAVRAGRGGVCLPRA